MEKSKLKKILQLKSMLQYKTFYELTTSEDLHRILNRETLLRPKTMRKG